MCDDNGLFRLPAAFRRVCKPPIEPIDLPVTNLQDYVRRTRVAASRPGLRVEGTPGALAVVGVADDAVTVAALARGAPRTIDLVFVPVVPLGSSISSSIYTRTLSLLPTPTRGLMLGTLPPNSLVPNTEYQFTVSASFQYGDEAPRTYAQRDVRGHLVVHRLWTHGAPTVTSIDGRMVQLLPPAINPRRPAYHERRSPGDGPQDAVADLGRGPQTELMQVFVVFASTVPGTETAVVGPLTSGIAFAPSSLPPGVEYDASYALAVYAFNGESVEGDDEYMSPLFTVSF
jgi:hypothetical protein